MDIIIAIVLAILGVSSPDQNADLKTLDPNGTVSAKANYIYDNDLYKSDSDGIIILDGTQG